MRRRLTGLFLLFLVLPHCAPVKPLEPSPERVAFLQQFKAVQDDWNNQHYEALTQREGEVSCQTADSECGALHLMAGDACFRTSHYACAADHLERGIAQTPQEALNAFGIGMDPIQVYIALMESLRFLQTHETPSALVAKRLVDVATVFRAMAPSHPAGPFFMGIGQLTVLRETRAQIKDFSPLCQALSEVMEALQKVGPPSSSIRDITHYRQLLSDMALAQQGIPKCGQ